MKKGMVIVCVCLLLFALVSCQLHLQDGHYFMVGAGDAYSAPYIHMEPDSKQIRFGSSTLTSYAEHGTYTYAGKQLHVKTQNAAYVWDVIGEDTLVLAESENDPFAFELGSTFVHETVLDE